MANLNKVMIIGNLTADPDVRTTPRGNTVAELRLAVNRVSSGPNEGERREETTFLDVTCWGRTAEIAGQYLAKGRPVFIEGRLQQDTWEDKQTGQRRSRIRIVAENMQLLGSRGDGGGQQQGGGSYQQRSNNYNNGGGYSNGGGNYGGGQGGYSNGGGNYGGGYSNGNGGGYSNGGYQQQRPQQQTPPPPMPAEEDDDIPF